MTFATLEISCVYNFNKNVFVILLRYAFIYVFFATI